MTAEICLHPKATITSDGMCGVCKAPLTLIKPEASQGASLPPAAEAAKEPEAPFQVDLQRVGWMTIHVNLNACSYHQELIDQYAGFMERMRSRGLNIIAKINGDRNAAQAQLQKDKNGFNLRKIFTRK